MDAPDPVAFMLLTQTVSFLFTEVGKILAERRTTRQNHPAKKEAKLSTQTRTKTITSPNELSSLKPNTLQLHDLRDEMEHCLKLIHQYRENRRLLEAQAAKYGGFDFAPLHVQNQIIDTEQEILNNCQKLKGLVEEVYDRKLIIKGLD